MISTDTLPTAPGCYLFKDGQGTVIYVGKAKNLKHRVSSYFTGALHDPKTRVMLSHATDLEVVVTASETEALLLENALVKQHQPRYNVHLKDAKTFAYIRCTDDTFPRLTMARRRDEPGDYYGPFVSARERDTLLQFLQNTFGLRTCRRLPKRPCLRFHINRCSAPCDGHISLEDYRHAVDQAREILRGRATHLLTQMKQDLKRHTAQREYERALILRDQIAAIELLRERQIIDRDVAHDEDVIQYIERDDVVYIMVFNVREGLLNQTAEYLFEAMPDFFSSFIVQYYDEHPVPKELIVPEPLDEAVAAYLSYKRKRKVRVTVPQRGAKKRLLALARKNIAHVHLSGIKKTEALGARLMLPGPPQVIECFDISHLGGTAMVGSMVQFRAGNPDKNNYRRFRIRSVDTIDDYAAIAEVVHRRYARLKREGQPLPDLIVIDGGRGQRTAAQKTLDSLGLTIPLVAIAKRDEVLFVPGHYQPLRLDPADRALQYVQEMRDEAHRFALAYHHLLRTKEVAS